jgi:hypothetical protein
MMNESIITIIKCYIATTTATTTCDQREKADRRPELTVYLIATAQIARENKLKYSTSKASHG